jgi:hypothetical protein
LILRIAAILHEGVPVGNRHVAYFPRHHVHRIGALLRVVLDSASVHATGEVDDAGAIATDLLENIGHWNVASNPVPHGFSDVVSVSVCTVN